MCTEAITAINNLLARVSPTLGDRVDIDLSGEGFEYSVSGGRLKIRAEDPSTATAAFHQFSSRVYSQRFTWGNPSIELPSTLRDLEPVVGSTEFRHRYYLNVVTSGYSSPFWDWSRWEQEIDWMALHGVNRPLMIIGHEAVLFQCYRELGLSEETALAWLGSAAHLPWMFMGGVNSWGGPMSTEYLQSRIKLGIRVLDRMRNLGMTPVLPGFAGHVPTVLADEQARSITWQGWETPYLDPTSKTYREVAAQFYQVQKRLLGAADYYAVDPFIESIPPSGNPEWLTAAAEGIYEAIAAHAPGATWLLQGWPFHYQREFWTNERAEAFVSGAPENKLLILDLWAEFAPLWTASNSMFGKPWIWCVVHNYGGRFALFGDLDGVIEDIRKARTSPDRGRLLGLGAAMEAIENNEVFYELLLDQIWESSDLSEWLTRWAVGRYGSHTTTAIRVWKTLLATLYSQGRRRSIPSPIIARPWSAAAPYATQRLAGEALPTDQGLISANIDAENDPKVLGDLPRLLGACEMLMSLPSGRLRDQDLQQILTHVVAQHARHSVRGILQAFNNGDREGLIWAAKDLYAHIAHLETVASTQEETLVGKWIADARASACTEEEADRFEFDARSLVTVWGKQSSGLHDYSGRHWAGLLQDFYLPRWRIWVDWLLAGARRPEELHSEIIELEESWRTSTKKYPPKPSASLEAVALEVVAWLTTHAMQPITPERGEDNE